MYPVLSKEKLSENIYRFVVEAENVSRHCLPGQFLIVKTFENSERIPLTICDYDREKKTVTIVVQTASFSTQLMTELENGDAFYDVVGPLGKPSELTGQTPEELAEKKIVFVAGGVGTAPVYPQVKWLYERGVICDVIIGAKNKDLVIMEDEFKDICNLYITTDDGSYGRNGMVTKALEDLVQE